MLHCVVLGARLLTVLDVVPQAKERPKETRKVLPLTYRSFFVVPKRYAYVTKPLVSIAWLMFPSPCHTSKQPPIVCSSVTFLSSIQLVAVLKAQLN